MTDIDDKLMTINYTYPDADDEDLQYKIYKKREFYYHKIPERPDIKNYNDMKEYRDNICAGEVKLFDYQSLLGNIINPDTPYKGMIIFHGLGTGKCVHPKSEISVKINTYEEKFIIEDLWELYSSNIILDNDNDNNNNNNNDNNNNDNNNNNNNNNDNNNNNENNDNNNDSKSSKNNFLANNGEWAIPSKNLETLTYTGKHLEYKKISKLYREKINGFIKIYKLEDNTEIRASITHKFLTNENKWTNTLITGQYMYKYEKNQIKKVLIKSVELIKYTGYLYDLEIDVYHNYIVNNIITHNTCAGVAIAEKFKPLVQKYNTKIVILVPGPLIKESWKHHIIKCTGETYLKKIDKSQYIDHQELDRLKKNALAQAMQYYKFMSYKSFHKRVLGERIIEKREGTKITYRKTEEGEFERDVAVDRIHNLNNTVIIIDEAHNLTGNAYGEALQYIIKNSSNLKVVLMSATPMKNLADDIVDLINFLRPIDHPIERDKIFTGEKNYEMKLKQGGIEYFKKMANGYISHVRGSDPLVFAKKVEKGEKADGLLFTKVTKCKMSDFQRGLYDKTKVESEDALDRKAEAVANFVFPALSNDKKMIEPISGNEGLNLIKNQLKSFPEILNKKIGSELLKSDKETEWLSLTSDGQTITGKIFKKEYLKTFSTKFYKALKKINRLTADKKGAKTAFIYSNLVRVGIDIFAQILLQNGYLEFQEDIGSYQINSDTVCYYCGVQHKNHNIENIENKKKDKTDKTDKTDSVSSTEYKKSEIKSHTFYPATFITVTGKGGEDTGDVIPEEKKRIIDDVFNNFENKEGKFLKLILGSKVMNEGVSLFNTAEVHILDVYYNFGRVDQVIGRGIRWCSHYKQMSEQNPFPSVNVYKYVVSIEKGFSSEEELYRKAEQKYLLIKKMERAMKEVAIDCPLNLQANIFKEEIKEFDKCGEKGKEECPQICDFTKCDYKCDNMKLNAEYYDPDRKIYKKIDKENLDVTTFSTGFAKTEIEYCKRRIKEMYILGFMYTLGDIISYVKKSYGEDRKDLFDEFFVYKALNDLIPITENDINSYSDTIFDKDNRSGYLIFVDKYYIFQPFDQNEDVPIYYRTKYMKPITQPISLFNYIKNTDIYKNYKDKKLLEEDIAETTEITDINEYDFDSVMEYYDNRNENKYVGIIEKDKSRKKNIEAELNQDVFKIREKRAKILEKKRATGIPSLKGAVCTTREKEYIQKVIKELKINTKEKTRQTLCEIIMKRMLELEKYSTGDDKKTYIMIPSNHPTYPFPYNLEDRSNIIKKEIKDINSKIDIEVKKNKLLEDRFNIIITIKDDKIVKDNIDDINKILDKWKGQKIKDEYKIILE